GNPVLDAQGNRQPVAQSSPKANFAKNRASAMTEVPKLRGKPVDAPAQVTKPPHTPSNPGDKPIPGFPTSQSKGRQGAKRLFPDGTTNDPNRAAHDGMSWQQAQSYLMTKYDFNRAQARSILVAAGWKPS